MYFFDSPNAPDVHIWYLPIDANCKKSQSRLCKQSLLSVLNDEERSRHQRFRVAHAAEQFLLARSMLRLTLARYLQCSAQEISFDYNEYGRPQLADKFNRKNISFNLSHCKEVIALAVSQKRLVGVDVETWEREIDFQSISRNVLNQKELKQLNAQTPILQKQTFFKYWTLKESYSKALGMGLSLPFDEIIFDIEGQTPRILKKEQTAVAEDAWCFSQMNLINQNIIAVAATAAHGEQLVFNFRQSEHPLFLLQT